MLPSRQVVFQILYNNNPGTVRLSAGYCLQLLTTIKQQRQWFICALSGLSDHAYVGAACMSHLDTNALDIAEVSKHFASQAGSLIVKLACFQIHELGQSVSAN